MWPAIAKPGTTGSRGKSRVWIFCATAISANSVSRAPRSSIRARRSSKNSRHSTRLSTTPMKVSSMK